MIGNNALDYSSGCEFLLNATQGRGLGKNNPNLLSQVFFANKKKTVKRKMGKCEFLKEGLSIVRNLEKVLEIEIWTRNIQSHIY